MRSPIIRYVEADNIPPTHIDDGDEVWWMGHYTCDCGWISHDTHDDLPDDGRALAERHARATGHRLSEEVA